MDSVTLSRVVKETKAKVYIEAEDDYKARVVVEGRSPISGVWTRQTIATVYVLGGEVEARHIENAFSSDLFA